MLINEKEPTWNFLGFVDDNKKATTVEGHNILGGLDELYKMTNKVFACIAIADIDAMLIIIKAALSWRMRGWVLLRIRKRRSLFMRPGLVVLGSGKQNRQMPKPSRLF